ncbi:MAG: tyrosyl-tRNA synthetase [Parcubacteria group bacterium Greene0714_4]|nr:MAG: tyrosyl-tRNA synthetase [Parcubacteria group bacterium Greene0714_4]
MSIPDTALRDYFELCTFTPLDTIQEIMDDIEKGKENPKDVKMRMAKEVVSMYHGEEKAITAQKSFTETFSEGKIPDTIETVSVSSGASLVDVLVNSKIVSSKSDFRRLVAEGAIKNMETDEKIIDASQNIISGMTLKVGKRRFVKIEIE